MNKMVRSSKLTLKVIIVMLTVLIPAQSLVAQWLTPWLNRLPVTVSNSLATVLTDYQVKITLSTSNFNFALANTDGSDIRITDSDGTTLLGYWIESWSAGTAAVIWVKVPTIPSSGTSTLYLYYGNTSATTSTSNGRSTFRFFDDFESWNVTPHPSYWQDLSSSAPLPTPSADNTISVYDNKLYSFGGYGINHEVLNTVYEFNPATNIWTAKAPMPTARWGMVSVLFGNKIYVFGGQSVISGVESDANEIYDPVENSWVSRDNGNPLSTISMYTGTGVTHPDVIYFPGGKDGYKYWMTYTPYPSEAEENPSILRSHDGITWTDAGITNPVIPAGTSGAWNDQENPDPDFIFVPDVDGLGLGHDKWFMVWDGGDVATNSRKIALAWSDDGKTWTQYNGSTVNGNTNPVILSGNDANGAAWELLAGVTSRTVTPTLYYQDGTFYLYYAEEASGNNRGRVGLATFTWNNTTNSIVGLARNAGNPIIDLHDDAIFKSGCGHINISKNAGSNTYRMYVCRELLNSANFELGLLTSSSLTTGWTSQGKAIERGATGQWDEDQIYRSCPVVNSSGEIVLFNNNIRIYYGGIGSQGWRIGIADIDQTTGTVIKYVGGGPRPMPSEIAYQGVMGVRYLDKIHLFYGSYHYEYDPATDTYTRKNDVPNPRSWATCAVVGTHIYLIGGWELAGAGLGRGTNDNQELDLNTDTWIQKTPMPISRFGATRENPVIGGKIYVTHGWNWEGYFFTCNYVYDPSNDTWTQKGSANHARDGVACGIINGKLYVVGGRNSDIFYGEASHGLNYNEVYDPALDTWTPQSDPAGWATSGSNFAYSDGTATYPGSYQGNHGLVVRQPMDGSELLRDGFSPAPSIPSTGFRYAETTQNFGTTYALDFDWNVTTIGGVNIGFPIQPHGVVRLNQNSDWYGNLIFLLDGPTGNESPTLKWVYGHRGTLKSGLTWDNWHKVTVICESTTSNRVVFDGTQYSSVDIPDDNNGLIHYSPLRTASWNPDLGNIRFGVCRTTQYLDNVRVRKWAGIDPVTTVNGVPDPGGQWIGGVSTDWGNAANWSGGLIPTAGTDVVIPAASNQPVISSSTTAICNNLTINSGASLTINPGGQATIGVLYNSGTGTLTNNGTLNLLSDASGISSLILNSYVDNGVENIHLYLTGGGTVNDWKWHYISSPVTSLSTDVFTTGTGLTTNLAQYDESHPGNNPNLRWVAFDGWDYSIGAFSNPLSTFSTLNPGKGYNIYFAESNAEKVFGGMLNTQSETESLSYTTGTSNDLQGWNLIGNPFTSGLDWASCIRTQYVDNAIYFTVNNKFASYVAGVGTNGGMTLIPPMQGFFVKANQSGQTVTMPATGRGHTFRSRYKGEIETIPLIRLKIENQNASDETVIRFDEKAKNTYDSEFDAYKFSKTGTSVSLWTIIGPVSYSINGIPFPETVTEIPVGLNISVSGSFKLSATQLQRIDGYSVYLVDKTTGTATDLKKIASINFTSSGGMVTDRFIIRIVKNSTTGIENPVKTEKLFNIYASKGFVDIQTLSDDWDGKPGSVDLIDFTGRTIKRIDNAEFWKNSLIQIPVTGYKGIYFVRIQSGLMRHIGKIMIK
jgi:N-acetylneuraminic acid mutarotase